MPPKPKRKFSSRLNVWTLKDPQMNNHFQEVLNLHVSASAGVAETGTEDMWNNIKTGLLKTTEEVCGKTRLQQWRCETWWCNKHMEKTVTVKGKAFKPWKTGKDTRASYDIAKLIAAMQSTVLIKKPTRRSTRILTPSLQKSTTLLTSLEERMLMLWVTNQ